MGFSYWSVVVPQCPAMAGAVSLPLLIFSEDKKSLLIYREDKQSEGEEEGGQGDDKADVAYGGRLVGYLPNRYFG